MRNFLKVFFNTLTLAAVIVINIIAASGGIKDVTVGEISQRYDTLITPASYAFSIWGLIYLMLIAFVGFQWYALFSGKFREVIKRTAGFFVFANFANAAWLFFWLNEFIGVSVIIMFMLLFSLLILVFRHRMEVADPPVRILAFVWWPISLYFGWIILASVTNVAAYLESIYFEGGPFKAEIWTIIMIIAAAGIYFLIIFTRNMREAAVAGIWGLVAIGVRHWGNEQSIAITAMVAAMAIFIAISYQAYKNRHASPFLKLKRGEF